MPRIRSTKPSFFRHEGLQELELQYPHAKVMLFFSGLWGLCDNQGRFEWRPKQIKLDILPFIDYDAEETLSILSHHGYIEKYSHEDQFYGHVVNLKKHQRFSGKEAKDGEKFPPPNLENIIKINIKEASGKHRGSIGEVILEKIENIENQNINGGSIGEALGKQVGTQEKEKEKEKEKESITPQNGILTVGAEENRNPLKKSEKEKKKVPQKKKGQNPDTEPYWNLIRKKWVDFNKVHLRFNVEPIPKRDYSHIHRVIEKLRERAVGQAVLWTEPEALRRWENFLTIAYTKDDFLKKNFLPANLESKMQKIFNLIENPNGQQSTTKSVGKTIEFDRP